VRTLLILLLLPVGAWLLLCALLFASQRSFIYYPVPESHPPGAASIRLSSGDADLKVWVVPRAGPRAILYFGGNAEDVAFNLAGFASAFPGHSLYLVNYRGYGGSSGAPTEAGLQADAVAAFDHLRKHHTEISVIGRSLGSGVAIYLASVRPVHRLVLVTPFDSLVNVARRQMKFFPVALLLRDRFDSAARARAIRVPTLLVVAGADRLIARERSDALAAAFAAAPVRTVLIGGAGHNDIDSRSQYLESIAEFLGATPGV
jgi:pimeloyl-ACP methyl ester carboxylesterase